MHNLQRRFINRFIARAYILTRSRFLKRVLLNISTKLFIDSNNSIEYDKTNKIYWFKYRKEYLISVKDPYFDFQKKRFEKLSLDFFCQIYQPKSGDIILDIGAGIGDQVNFFTSKIGTKGSLYLVEASPSCFKRLNLLIKKNNYNNCFPHNIAISGKNGRIWIEEQENYRINQVNENSQGVEIMSCTLDRFMKDFKISKVDFLKVNIEGAEYDMVDGMGESINLIENIAVSCHDFLSNDSSFKIRNKIVHFLEKNGFQLTYRLTGDKVLDSWVYGKRMEDTDKQS